LFFIKENTIITTNKFGSLESNQIEEIPKEGEKREVDESKNISSIDICVTVTVLNITFVLVQ